MSSSLLTDPALDLLVARPPVRADVRGQHHVRRRSRTTARRLIYPDGVETAIVEVDHAAIPASSPARGQGRRPGLAKVDAGRPRAVTVDVLNGTDVARLAARNADRSSRARASRSTSSTRTPRPPRRTIEYPAGPQAAGQGRRAPSCQAPSSSQTSTVTRVTLVLGTNGVQVQGLSRRTARAATPAPHRATVRSRGTAGTGGLRLHQLTRRPQRLGRDLSARYLRRLHVGTGTGTLAGPTAEPAALPPLPPELDPRGASPPRPAPRRRRGRAALGRVIVQSSRRCSRCSLIVDIGYLWYTVREHQQQRARGQRQVGG